MLDDAFKLTIDVLFPKPEEFYDDPELNFVVDDYDESENLWEYVYSHKRINTSGISVIKSNNGSKKTIAKIKTLDSNKENLLTNHTELKQSTHSQHISKSKSIDIQNRNFANTVSVAYFNNVDTSPNTNRRKTQALIPIEESVRLTLDTTKDKSIEKITDTSKDKSIEFINISSNEINIGKMEETCDVFVGKLNITQENC